MTTLKVEEPNTGDYICVYLKHGWVQVKIELEGVVIDVFDHKDALVSTGAVPYEDLEPEIP